MVKVKPPVYPVCVSLTTSGPGEVTTTCVRSVIGWPVAASTTLTLIVAFLKTFRIGFHACDADRCCRARVGALSGWVTQGSGSPTVSRYLYFGSLVATALGSRPAKTTLPSAPVERVWVGEVLRSAVTGAPETGWEVRASMTVATIVDLPAIDPMDGGAMIVDWVYACARLVCGVTVTETFL